MSDEHLIPPELVAGVDYEVAVCPNCGLERCVDPKECIDSILGPDRGRAMEACTTWAIYRLVDNQEFDVAEEQLANMPLGFLVNPANPKEVIALTMDPDTYRLLLDGEDIELDETAWAILDTLAER